MAWIKSFGGYAVQGLLILTGAISILVFARDGFHVFLQEAFNWLIVLGDSILGAIFDQPPIRRAIEQLLNCTQSWLTSMGISVDLVLQPHWKHAFVLLYLAFSAYAHAFKNFAAKPAASIYRYINALFSALLGGVMAGTVPLAHPGMAQCPFSAFLLFCGFNCLWRGFVETREFTRDYLTAAALLLIGACFMVFNALQMEKFSDLGMESPSPGLLLVAGAIAGFGVWATVCGFGAKLTAVSPLMDAERLTPRWLDNPGRKMGLRVLATLGVAASLAGLGQAAWGGAREPRSAGFGRTATFFRDCPDCPEMALIPAGTFTMGTTALQKEQLQVAGLWGSGRFEDELPARNIIVPAFAIGRTEVTVAQFQSFVDATGYRPSGVCWGLHEDEPKYDARLNWSHPGFEQGPDYPVVCVTWWDAQAYVRWLSLKSGEAFRLPTEAEWEFAARAGTQTYYFWGDDPDAGCAYMNGADKTAEREFPNATVANCEDGARYTTSVASYFPNAFGLWDMAGNVWEWVQDDDVVRGGSWYKLPVRGHSRHSDRRNDLGFRVARSVSSP